MLALLCKCIQVTAAIDKFNFRPQATTTTGICHVITWRIYVYRTLSSTIIL